ncbi:hypothetical protein GOC69_03490 [Sinorhizobium medicae]|nr:hypothetical protein [Sinorhizobium medicae]MDX0471006.1 hypothetical protein [Sinorhizobium medicae]
MKDIKRGFEVEVYRRASPSHRTVPLPQRGKNCSLLFASREFIGFQMGEDHMQFRCDMSAVIVEALSKGSELLHFKARMEDLWPLLSQAEKQILVKKQPRFSSWLHEDVEAAGCV